MTALTRTLLLLVAAAAGLPLARATEPPCPPIASPEADWPSRAEEVRATRPAETDALDRYAFTLEGPDAARRGRRTDGLVVIHRGVVTYERYGRGFIPANRHLAWSISKSVTSALAGAAALRGDLALDDPLCRWLPSAPPARCGITLRHLLQFASGLDYTESYEGRTYQVSSVLAMLYGVGRRDMATFVLGHAARAAPGAEWAYSSGDSLLAAAVIGAAEAPRLGPAWPWPLLFERLGMASAAFEQDAAGTYLGASHFYASPRDLARLGWLYLAGGCWRGQRILADAFVRESVTPSAPLRAGSRHRHAGDVNGLAWWLNRPVPEAGQATRPWPGLPEDTFAARGHWGQDLVVVPSLELVVVRTADDRETGVLRLEELVALAIAAGRLP